MWCVRCNNGDNFSKNLSRTCVWIICVFLSFFSFFFFIGIWFYLVTRAYFSVASFRPWKRDEGKERRKDWHRWIESIALSDDHSALSFAKIFKFFLYVFNKKVFRGEIEDFFFCIFLSLLLGGKFISIDSFDPFRKKISIDYFFFSWKNFDRFFWSFSWKNFDRLFLFFSWKNFDRFFRSFSWKNFVIDFFFFSHRKISIEFFFFSRGKISIDSFDLFRGKISIDSFDLFCKKISWSIISFYFVEKFRSILSIFFVEKFRSIVFFFSRGKNFDRFFRSLS